MKFRHCERLSLIGKGLAFENVTKAKTNSAGMALMEIAPHVENLENAAAIAADELTAIAAELKACSTIGGEWDGTEESAHYEYKRLMGLAERLRSATTHGV